MFISCHYAEKVWTNHKRRSAQARALVDKEDYILPIRLDDTKVPGLLETVAYFDLRQKSLEELQTLLMMKAIKKKEHGGFCTTPQKGIVHFNTAKTHIERERSSW